MAKDDTEHHISNSMFDIPKEIVTATQVKGFLIFDVVYFVILVTLSLRIGNMVHHSVRIVAVIFTLVMGIFWILPSPVTKKKRNLEVLIMGFTLERQTFRPISVWPYIQKK